MKKERHPLGAPPGEGKGENRTVIEGRSSSTIGEILEDELKHAEAKEERRRALRLLAQICQYSIAITEDLKTEHALSYAHNPLEYGLKIWLREEEVDKRQRKLTDFF